MHVRKKLIIPKILELLETNTGSALKSIEYVPVWVWIFWLPQIIILYARRESEQLFGERLIQRMSALYPQAVFYPLMKCNKHFEELKAHQIKEPSMKIPSKDNFSLF